MRIKDEIFCFAHLRWCHNEWASNILIVYACIHLSKYWMPIHHDTIEDRQNKKSHLIFSKWCHSVKLVLIPIKNHPLRMGWPKPFNELTGIKKIPLNHLISLETFKKFQNSQIQWPWSEGMWLGSFTRLREKISFGVQTILCLLYT